MTHQIVWKMRSRRTRRTLYELYAMTATWSVSVSFGTSVPTGPILFAGLRHTRTPDNSPKCLIRFLENGQCLSGRSGLQSANFVRIRPGILSFSPPMSGLFLRPIYERELSGFHRSGPIPSTFLCSRRARGLTASI